MTKRTKVVASKVPIGDRLEPSPEGMEALAQSARRLVDAVRPFLPSALEAANAEIGADPDASGNLARVHKHVNSTR